MLPLDFKVQYYKKFIVIILLPINDHKYIQSLKVNSTNKRIFPKQI